MHSTPFEALVEFFGDQLPSCMICESQITGDCYFVDPSYVCQECFESWREELVAEARQFAVENLRFTSELPKFKQSSAWTISNEEYTSGERVSNTENAYRTRCRHEYTNYDSILVGLSKDSAIDHIWYQAVRERVDEMIDDKISQEDLIVQDDYED